MSSREGPSYSVSEDLLDNPLGTRAGEVRSWRRLRNILNRRNRVAVI
jgi:hypothetical protein